MYTALLRQIAIQQSRFKGSLQPPCSRQSIECLKRSAVQKLGHPVPEGYVDFLSMTNGLNWNGLSVFASERSPIIGHPSYFIGGFVDENLDYRDVDLLEDYLIFGSNCTVFYTYHISVSRYEVILSGGLSLLETFSTCEELLTDALQTSLSGQ